MIDLNAAYEAMAHGVLIDKGYQVKLAVALVL